jgi:hypothetical protein
MTRIAFFDPGETMGVAFTGTDPERPILRHWLLLPHTPERRPEGYAQLAGLVRDLVLEHYIEQIGVEAPKMTIKGRSPESFRAAIARTTIILAVAGQLKIPAREGDEATIRHHFLGWARRTAATPQKGSVVKLDVFHRCQALRWVPTNMDESDAAAGWDWLTCTLKSETTMARARRMA